MYDSMSHHKSHQNRNIFNRLAALGIWKILDKYVDSNWINRMVIRLF